MGYQLTNISKETTGVRPPVAGVCCLGRKAKRFCLCCCLVPGLLNKWQAIGIKVSLEAFKEEEVQSWTSKDAWVWRRISGFKPVECLGPVCHGWERVCGTDSRWAGAGQGWAALRKMMPLSFWVRSFQQYRVFAQDTGQMGTSLKGKDSHMWATLGSSQLRKGEVEMIPDVYQWLCRDTTQAAC